MKTPKILIALIMISITLTIAACGGGGSSSDTGTVAMSVTDAKPLLPQNATNLLVTFTEAWVHKPGEGWIPLDLIEPEYTIDLLQFHDGVSTDLVTPTELSAGKYTQVRIVVSEARMIIDNGVSTEEVTLEIPSEHLKTDKNFTVDVAAGAYMDIVIHFDLSMSVVASGPSTDPTYSLKPVLHLFEDPMQAAIIQGSISASSFGDSNKAAVVVIADSNNEEFTRLEVTKESDTDPTDFSIHWLVPNESYTVQIDLNHDSDSIDNDCEQFVNDFELGEGQIFDLNDGESIETTSQICS